MSESWYDRTLLPHALDCACGLGRISRQRRKVVPNASGDVLEIGIGTGLNMRFYDKSKVKRLVGLDPATQMNRLAQKRSQQAGLPVDFIAASAEDMPFPDASFDSLVCTYTLCSIPDPLRALREMKRVLRPAGKLVFAEHGLAPDAAVKKWQFRLEPYWGKVAGGCHLTRDIPSLIQEGGFQITFDAAYVAWPKSLAYNFWGEATSLGERHNDSPSVV